MKGKGTDLDQLRRLIASQEKELNELRGNEIHKIEKDGQITTL